MSSGVAVGGALDVSRLNLIGGGRSQHLYGEGGFEQDLAFAPVNDGVKIEAWTVVARGGSHAADPRAWEPALLQNLDPLRMENEKDL